MVDILRAPSVFGEFVVPCDYIIVTTWGKWLEKMSKICILMQVPLVNVNRLRGFTKNISQYFVESRAPQTEAGSGVWVCCACDARPVVAVRAKCGHLFCHVCSIRQRSVSTPFSSPFSDNSNKQQIIVFRCPVCGVEMARDQMNYLA